MLRYENLCRWLFLYQIRAIIAVNEVWYANLGSDPADAISPPRGGDNGTRRVPAIRNVPVGMGYSSGSLPHRPRRGGLPLRRHSDISVFERPGGHAKLGHDWGGGDTAGTPMRDRHLVGQPCCLRSYPDPRSRKTTLLHSPAAGRRSRPPGRICASHRKRSLPASRHLAP